MLPVAQGEAVSVVVAEWADDPAAGFAAVPFDPPLTVPFDLATPARGRRCALVETALRLRDDEGWLVHRPPYVAGRRGLSRRRVLIGARIGLSLRGRGA